MMSSPQHLALRERAGFDPARRSPPEDLLKEIRELTTHPLMTSVLNAAGSELIVINRHLQIVATNGRMVERLRQNDGDTILGQRIGDVLGCANADISPEGCGSTRDCTLCGALNSVLESRANHETVTEECLLSLSGDNVDTAMELNVTASPLPLDDQAYTVVALTDISDRKRREALERLFLHDLRNALQGVIGWSEILVEDPSDNTEQIASRIATITRRLGDDIESHRLLVAAETNALVPARSQTSPAAAISRLMDIFAHQPSAESKTIGTFDPVSSAEISTDPAVLERVLINMVKNALEATPDNGTVRVGGTVDGNMCRFRVWNEGVIPDEISAHIFKRSFSTKGESGRGLGTHSMKLFGERILGGTVRFTSNDTDGTTFFLEIPRSIRGD